MFKSHSNTHEAGNPVRDTVLIALTVFIASAVLFNLTSAVTLNADAHDVLMQTVSRVFLTLALAAFPLVICLVALPWSDRESAPEKTTSQE